ncbi:MAG: anaerobic ribonucleoside-triphosphate reductase activating protein [Planctomycetota bacterium]
MRQLAGMRPIFYGMLKRTSLIDFEGRLARVFFTAGCNFRCPICHNPEMVYAAEGHLPWEKVAAVLDRDLEDWVNGVVISGGEPTIHPELGEVIQAIRDRGLAVKLDTNGALRARLEAVHGRADFVAMDLKGPLDRYREIAGVAIDPAEIRASLRLLASRPAGSYEVRTTVIAGVHTADDMRAAARELVGIARFVLQPFVPQESLLDPACAGRERTTDAYLREMLAVVQPIVPGAVIRGINV